MKQYHVKLDTIIQGRPVFEKDIISLSDEDAKGYKAAGLIAEVKNEADDAKAEEKAEPKAPAKKADK
ncbi:hypothetical protein [Ochrobactrum soli]|uniref:Uncharacterized protein n=1 Tax=Ochrobactrum soli TaxID=2448455 RepID=A0A2P9HMQ3_9HYPH|nr:hypothetical protein [[Ochrobactrum] soli]SPL65354.1 hypothetical protein OHAE_1221 [[Ochrobactrum] soli]